MSIESVKQYMKTFGRENDVMEFTVSSATVALAAEALGVEPGRIAKTLSFKKDDSCILVVTAGDVKIDNSKYKHTFGLKAKMLTADEAVELIGHAVGGVCPFAVKETVVGIYIDESVKRFETVFPACGSSNSAIELTPDELFSLSKATAWVDITRLIEQ
ncbi:MAG: YbaK/EbsC family protein [Ruminococcaceae bacterium]|nr:YbaK/EbsC family protein [Oscillospiraceae bacterium]